MVKKKFYIGFLVCFITLTTALIMIYSSQNNNGHPVQNLMLQIIIFEIAIYSTFILFEILNIKNKGH